MPLPKPGPGEERKPFLTRCISFVKKEDPNTPNDQAVSMCSTQWTNRIRDKMDSKKINFSVPITESGFLNKGTPKEIFKIRGVAINETTTRNGHKFIAEELEDAAPSLADKPILKDHENTVDSTVGRTGDAFFDASLKAVVFDGTIMDKGVQEKILDGRINSVSVGAFLKGGIDQEFDEEGEPTGALIARGIDFVELSVIPVPADAGALFTKVEASYTQAIQEAYNTQQDTVRARAKKAQEKTTKEEITMAEEAIEKTKLELLREERSALEEELETMKVAKLQAEKENLLKEEAEPEKKPEEAKPEEEPAAKEEEPAAEPKGETGPVDEEPATESTKDYILEQGDMGGWALTPSYDAIEGLSNLRTKRY